MKLKKTFLPILMALIVSVSSIQTTYHLGRTLGDYSHFAESLFSNNKVEAPDNDEYYMNHNPPAKNFVNDLDIFSRDGEHGNDFKIKDLMKYVITPENELDNLSSKGQLSFEIQHDNIVNELEKKKNESNQPKKINIPGTNESFKTSSPVNSLESKHLEKSKNLRVNKSIENTKSGNTVNDVKVKQLQNIKSQPTVLNLKVDSIIKSNSNSTLKSSEKQKEVPNKKQTKEELLNDIFSDME